MSVALYQCEYVHAAPHLFAICLKHLPTERTLMWSSVAVYTTLMCLQVA